MAGALASATLLVSSNVSNDAVKAKKVTLDEFVKHDSVSDCWIAIDNKVYDFTDFIPNHPGGVRPLAMHAGHDGSEIYHKLHPKGTVENNLPVEKFMGILDGEAPQVEQEFDPYEETRLAYVDNIPPIGSMQNLYDFEKVAKLILPRDAWAYYSCGSDDEISMRENHYAYQRIYFRPRVGVNVKNVDTSYKLLGTETDVPFYVTATALAKLGHPDGECSIARGAGKENVIQMISTLSSNSLEEIAQARIPGATQWFQLYINEDREVTKSLIKRAEDSGMKAIFVTLDAPSLGNREKDKRLKFTNDTDVDLGANADRSSGASKALSSFIDAGVCWDDVKQVKEWTKLPVLAKGVQTPEDIILAMDLGLDGVVISNHGGRQLDTAPPPIEVLAETIPILKRLNKTDPNFQVLIDGGVKRGTDILKAIAVGDQCVNVGVGLGRPFLYANSAYGEDGVQKTIQILKDELEMSMRLLGVTKMSDLGAQHVNTKRLIGRDAANYLYDNNYTPIDVVRFANEDDDA